jgi:hypothetical protein
MNYPLDKFGLLWVSPKTGQVLDAEDIRRLKRLAKVEADPKPPVKGAAARFFQSKDSL